MTNENKDEAKRASRITLLVRSCLYDEATAAKMVDGTWWLTPDEFQAHADYLAARRSAVSEAADQDAGRLTSAKLHSQESTLPSRTAGQPAEVKTTGRDRLASVRAEIADFLAEQVFGLQDEPQG